LWTLMKNYGDRALRRTLGVALALAARRLLDETDLDRGAPLARALAPFVARCRRREEQRPDATWPAAAVYERSNGGARGRGPNGSSTGGSAENTTGSARSQSARPPALRHMPLESLGATAAALSATRTLAPERAVIQDVRQVPDAEILPRFGRNLE